MILNKYLKIKIRHFGTGIPDSRHFQPVPGKKNYVESELDVKNNKIRPPGAKNWQRLPPMCFMRFSYFFFNWKSGLITLADFGGGEKP